MKKNILFFCFVFLNICAFAQIKATTDKGEKVILYDDGTWQFEDSLSTEEKATLEDIKTSTATFVKANNAKTLLEGKKWKYGIWYNNVKWGNKETAADRDFLIRLKLGDAYVMAIAEEMQVPIEMLINVVMNNARKLSDKANLINQEYRTVNGLRVLHMQYSVNLKGINFIYYGYYYSCEKGTVQLVGFTSENLFSRYENDILQFINGFVGEKY
jgi:hypothetical protein